MGVVVAESKSEILRQLSETWQTAQRQLAELREQVERTGELAQAKVQQGFLERERDRVFRDLGEAVWQQVQKGKLSLPASVGPAVRAAQELQRRLDTHHQEITELLRGGEPAAKPKREAKTLKTTVAARTKKR